MNPHEIYQKLENLGFYLERGNPISGASQWFTAFGVIGKNDLVFSHNTLSKKWYSSGKPTIERNEVRFNSGFYTLDDENVIKTALKYIEEVKKLNRTLRLQKISEL